MSECCRNIAVLGSTGSIGCSTLDVIRASRGRFRAIGLTANQRLPELCEQAQEFRPDWVVGTDTEFGHDFDWGGLPTSVRCLQGHEGLSQLVQQPEVEIVVAAIVGSAGLTGTWAAIDAGKTVALANKETLVMAGQLVMDLAKRRNARILPIDSEHSAVFQCLDKGRREDVKRVILTASGGPFRLHSAKELENVTVQRGSGPSHVEYGAEDHHRLGHDDE